MKKKLIILTLCFTIIISSVNIKRSYALVDGGFISLPILATVVTLGVGTGLVLKSDDDIYDLGRMFYDYISSSNSYTWDMVTTAFQSSVILNNNRLVNVGGSFLDIVKSFYNDTFSSYPSNFGKISSTGGIPAFDGNKISSWSDVYDLGIKFDVSKCVVGGVYKIGSYTLKCVEVGTSATLNAYYNDVYVGQPYLYMGFSKPFSFVVSGTSVYAINPNGSAGMAFACSNALAYDFPYTGGYDWGKVEENKKEGDLPLGVPGNLGDLVNTGDNVFNPSYDLTDGNVTAPAVDNATIGVTEDTFVKDTTGTDTDIGTDTDTPGGITFPSFGDSIDFSPLEATGITDKFPFSLPWDIGRLISTFDVTPIAPKFEFPILGEKLTIDFTEFEEWAKITRFFVQISFIGVLIFISTRMKG